MSRGGMRATKRMKRMASGEYRARYLQARGGGGEGEAGIRGVQGQVPAGQGRGWGRVRQASGQYWARQLQARVAGSRCGVVVRVMRVLAGQVWCGGAGDEGPGRPGVVWWCG